ncbi:MAG: hypothetical protein WCJ95_09625 [Mariniphaga sp.]
MITEKFIASINSLPVESRERIAKCLFAAYAELTPIDVILINTELKYCDSLSSQMLQYYKLFRIEKL